MIHRFCFSTNRLRASIRKSRNHLLDTIEEFARAGRTILYTTHYMEEAERLCDRVAIMDQGKILAVDTVDELLRKHGGLSMLEAELARHPRGRLLAGAARGQHAPLRHRRAFRGCQPAQERGRPVRSLSRRSAQSRIRVFEPDRPEASRLMRAMLTLTLKDLLLLWRNKTALFWVIVFPLAFGLFYGAIIAGRSFGPPPR